MSIRIVVDWEFGSTWYIKNDPEQVAHLLVGVVLMPGNQFRFRLNYIGDIVELWDFECTKERGEVTAEDDLEL